MNDSGKASWQYIIDQLTSNKVALFSPLAPRSEQVLLARVGDGQYVELVLAEQLEGTSYKLSFKRSKPHLFVVAIESIDENIAWILPSGIYERFAVNGVLNFESSFLDPLESRLAVYKNRWALISQFSKFRSTLNDPTALQVQLALG